MIERCAVGVPHLDPRGPGVQTGGRFNPPHPAPPPGTAVGDDLLLRTDVPGAEMSLRSATAARVTGTSIRIARLRSSIE